MAHELRQPGSDEGDRQATLRGPMQGRDESTKLTLGHILQFVDEQRQHRAARASRLSRYRKERGQVGVEIAAVRNAFFPVQIDGEADVLIADLHRADESCE